VRGKSSVTITVSLIVAIAENGVIGERGALPWRLSSDLRRFRRLTIGKPVIMGRKTYQSIGKPLPQRDNIIVTRQVDFRADGIHAAASTEAALELAHDLARRRGADEIMVIGGAEIYRALLPHAGRIHLTEVHTEAAGDTRLGPFDPVHWREVARERASAGARDDADMSFVTLERRA